VGLAWMLVPFWEMKHRPDGRARPITIIGVVGIIYMVVMTIWGYLV
jgi:quinol-cytochrome oxidoreductase complex cytochrome b subunit